MDTFADYYAVLGVKPNASASAIKAAFKKLALQYHPDVYKGEDAQERMRILLLAYQTLSDPASRRAYDARRSEHFFDAAPVLRRDPSSSPGQGNLRGRSGPEVTPTARRDRQRHYDFPDVGTELASVREPVQVNLGDMTYHLSPKRAQRLVQAGMLRGIAPEASGKGRDVSLPPSEALEQYPHHCHRCHHRWTPASRSSPIYRGSHSTQAREPICPACKASDWGEYLLLRCIHCHAVFESEQIRYEIGSYNYGDRSLCPPYELFPLCPYFGASGWNPAEDVRVRTLRAEAKRRLKKLDNKVQE
jgi:DnaJ-like protein